MTKRRVLGGINSKLATFETGSWVPDVNFGGSSTGIVYESRFGEYTKIANIITVFATIVMSSKGSSTGSVTVSGLPYPAAADGLGFYGGSSSNLNNLAGLNGPLMPSVGSGASFVGIRQISESNGTGNTDPELNNTNFNDGALFGISLTYRVD